MEPHFWGVAEMEIQKTALGRRSFSVLKGNFLFPDGSFVALPGNALLEARSFDEAWVEGGKPFPVYIGTRKWNDSSENVTVLDKLENLWKVTTRFVTAADPEEVTDLHSGGPKGEVKRLHYVLKIFWEKELDKLGDYVLIQEKDPTKLPWGVLNIDVVVESTGVFESYEKASAHLIAGAKRVVITAPAKGRSKARGKRKTLAEAEGYGKTILMGVNENEFNTCQITSNGSCTTNAVHPVAQIMPENPGIKKAILNTIHAYTATQKTVDGPDAKDWRRGRAAAVNIVPSTTGAAISVTEAVKGLKGRFDGIAIRVPLVTGSLADFTFVSTRPTSVEEINNIFREAAKNSRWQGILKITEEPLVSSDIIGETSASIVDLSFTKVIDGDLVKVLAWYDNEWGYSAILIEHVIKAGMTIKNNHVTNMNIYLAADHAGFELKENIKKFLADLGYEIKDFGAFKY